MFKHQESFAAELAESWTNGNKSTVRLTIRGLKNKAQAAYIATTVYALLAGESLSNAESFRGYVHPNHF